MFDLQAIDLDKSVNDNEIDTSIVLRNLSHDAFQAALGWKLMYLVCREPRQFWAWQDEQELAFVLAERARVEEAGMVLLPLRAESLVEWEAAMNLPTHISEVYGIDEFGDLYDLEPIPRFRPSEY